MLRPAARRSWAMSRARAAVASTCRWSRTRSTSSGHNTACRARMATDSGQDMGYKGYDPAFGGDTRAFKELVDSVDFPKFVADLLKAVFDANLKVMKQQTDSYIKLMKEATKSHAPTSSRRSRTTRASRSSPSRSGDQYNVITEKAPDGSSKLALTNPEGDKVDPEDAEVKRAHPRSQDQHGQGAPGGAARGAAHGGHPAGGQEGRDRGRRRVQRQGPLARARPTTTIRTSTSRLNLEIRRSPLGGLFGGPSGSFE